MIDWSRLLLKNQILKKVVEWNDSATDEEGHQDVHPKSPEEANVITSEIDRPNYPPYSHKVVLDIDFPCKLEESSTPGHYHLYIDCHPMRWEQYLVVLEAMANAGILEHGYVNAAQARGYTAVRLPWIKKEKATFD